MSKLKFEFSVYILLKILHIKHFFLLLLKNCDFHIYCVLALDDGNAMVDLDSMCTENVMAKFTQ